MRYDYTPAEDDNCLTLHDNNEQLQTDFGTDIVLYPLEDARFLVNHMNKQETLIEILIRELRGYEYSDENIKELMEEAEYEMED